MFLLQFRSESDLLRQQARCKNKLANLRDELARLETELARLDSLSHRKYEEYSELYDHFQEVRPNILGGPTNGTCPYGLERNSSAGTIRAHEERIAELLQEHRAAIADYNDTMDSRNSIAFDIRLAEAERGRIEKAIVLAREREREEKLEIEREKAEAARMERERAARVLAAARIEKERAEKAEAARLEQERAAKVIAAAQLARKKAVAAEEAAHPVRTTAVRTIAAARLVMQRGTAKISEAVQSELKKDEKSIAQTKLSGLAKLAAVARLAALRGAAKLIKAVQTEQKQEVKATAPRPYSASFTSMTAVSRSAVQSGFIKSKTMMQPEHKVTTKVEAPQSGQVSIVKTIAVAQIERERIAQAERLELERSEQLKREHMLLCEKKNMELIATRQKHRELQEQYQQLGKVYDTYAGRVNLAQEESKREWLRFNFLYQKKEALEKQVQQLSSQVTSEANLLSNVSVAQLDLTAMSAAEAKDPQSVYNRLQIMRRQVAKVSQTLSAANNNARQQQEISMLAAEKKQVESDLQQAKLALESLQIRSSSSKKMADKIVKEAEQHFAKIDNLATNIAEQATAVDNLRNNSQPRSSDSKQNNSHAQDHTQNRNHQGSSLVAEVLEGTEHLAWHVAEHTAQDSITDFIRNKLGEKAATAVSAVFNVLSVLPSTEMLSDGHMVTDDVELALGRETLRKADEAWMRKVDAGFKALSQANSQDKSSQLASVHTLFSSSSSNGSSAASSSNMEPSARTSSPA